jgi:hypothetical protein
MFLKHVMNLLQLVEFGRRKYAEVAEVVTILCSSSTTSYPDSEWSNQSWSSLVKLETSQCVTWRLFGPRGMLEPFSTIEKCPDFYYNITVQINIFSQLSLKSTSLS